MTRQKKLGEELTRLRKGLRYSQGALAGLAGIHQTTLCNIEKGRQIPGLAVLAALAVPLDLSPSEIGRLVLILGGES